MLLVAGSADEWEDIVSNCFVPLSCLGFEATFRGTMHHTKLDDRTSVSTVTTSGTSAERRAHDAARAESDDLHLSLQVSSAGVVSQDGRRSAVTAGDITTYATDRAYHLDYSRPNQQQLIIQVSRASLGLPDAMIDASCHRLKLPRIRAARVLFDYVAGLQRDGVAEVAVSTDAQTTRDLASAMIRSSFSSSPVMPVTDRGLLLTIEDYVRRNAARESLTLDEVAGRHHVSRRKLFQLFADEGRTPADYLRRLRLQKSAVLLADASVTATIPEIGYACGFNDPDTFTRAFRREYGLAPRDYRAGSPPRPERSLQQTPGRERGREVLRDELHPYRQRSHIRRGNRDRGQASDVGDRGEPGEDGFDRMALPAKLHDSPADRRGEDGNGRGHHRVGPAQHHAQGGDRSRHDDPRPVECGRVGRRRREQFGEVVAVLSGIGGERILVDAARLERDEGQDRLGASRDVGEVDVVRHGAPLLEPLPRVDESCSDVGVENRGVAADDGDAQRATILATRPSPGEGLDGERSVGCAAREHPGMIE